MRAEFFNRRGAKGRKGWKIVTAETQRRQRNAEIEVAENGLLHKLQHS
jgi:hypothetical protein